MLLTSIYPKLNRKEVEICNHWSRVNRKQVWGEITFAAIPLPRHPMVHPFLKASWVSGMALVTDECKMDKFLFLEEPRVSGSREGMKWLLVSRCIQILLPTVGTDRKYLASGRNRALGKGFLEETAINLSIKKEGTISQMKEGGEKGTRFQKRVTTVKQRLRDGK